jgi:hypothetical protein
MFGNLPEFLDHDYVVGFFLPAMVFVVGTAFLLGAFGILPWPAAEIWEFFVDHTVVATLLAGLTVWMVSLALLGGNIWLLRIKEGYPRVPVLRSLLVRRQRRRFREARELLERFEWVYQKRRRRGRKLPDALRQMRILLKWRLATDFPDDEAWLLPWPFGNRLRAFEVYSRVMYGLDAIAGWSRLRAVIPPDYLKVVNGAKSQVDFAVNLWAVWWFLLGEHAVLAVSSNAWRVPWFPAVAAVCIFLSSTLARSSVVLWGEAIKAAFDVFLPELRRVLGLPAPASREQAQRQWRNLSHAYLYRAPDYLPGFGLACPTCGRSWPEVKGAGEAAEVPSGQAERPVEPSRLTVAV